MYIILKGKAREFGPKSIETLEKESLQYKPDLRPQIVDSSIIELVDKEGHPSEVAEPSAQEADGSALEQPAVKQFNPSVFKKLQKVKAMLPFLKQMATQKTATQRVSEYNYKQSLRKTLNPRRNQPLGISGAVDYIPEGIELENLKEFKKLPRVYFLGGILKVEFLKDLLPGECCGIKALTDNALTNRAIIADEDCECIVLSKEDFTLVLDDEKTLNAEKIEFFKGLFHRYNDNYVTRFSLLWEHQSHQINDTVFRQNDRPQYLYALCKGEVIVRYLLASLAYT